MTKVVIAVGNPSRGDDAIGPLIVERLGAMGLRDIDLITDFQLQVENALDFAGCDEVVFVDASVAAAAPFEFDRVYAAPDTSATTHALSPAAVLDTYRRVIGEPPAAWVLAIRGYAFELGEALSTGARDNLDAAVEMLAAHFGADVLASPA